MPAIQIAVRPSIASWSVGLVAAVFVCVPVATAMAQSDNGFAPPTKNVLPAPTYSASPSNSTAKPPSQSRSISRPQPPAAQVRSKRASKSRSEGDVTVPYCSIEFIDDIRLPALEAGAVQAINVEEGQYITANTIVGQIDDAIPQLELDRAKLRYSIAYEAARDSTSILAAQKEYDLARTRYSKNVRLQKRGSRSESEVKESLFQKEIAQLKTVKASNDREMALGEAKVELAALEAVKQRIARHTLRSEYNAYVVQIFKKPQEYVNVGDDVMRLARMDRMWVQASVNAQELNAADAENRPVTVTLQTASGAEEFKGKIDQVSLENVSAEEYQVKIKVQNRRQGNAWLLRPFSQVSMVIHMDRPIVKDVKAGSTSKQAQLPSGSF